METLLSDFRYGVRSVRKDCRFAAMVVLTLTICIGANTALFTIVNSVLLQPLPVPGADAIILMSNKYPKAGSGDSSMSSSGDYYDRLRAVTVFQDQAMYEPIALTLNEHGTAERIPGVTATPSLFRLLQVAPALGRVFMDSESEVGAHLKVILSYALWQKLYAGDLTVLGRELRLNDRPFQIVGVMPRNFLFCRSRSPLLGASRLYSRPKDGPPRQQLVQYRTPEICATIASAQGQIDALNAANLELMGPLKPILINVGFHTEAAPLKDYLVKDVKGTLFLLWGGAHQLANVSKT